ncbi:MAG: thiamine phosphate synthase [Proteobacteria bacterium]|nr:MAG: thiamine phosphate synthase [Pseudomonadota bacterium]
MSAYSGTPKLSPLYYGSATPYRPFAFLNRSLGFYPVLPNVAWIERFANSGVKTLQLRIKDEEGAALKASILKAKAICEAHDIALFVNDAWQLAMECQVYGVHLGQEDLDALEPGAIEEIQASGLRLGISTHSLEEAARAAAYKPSYIALGPVFETTCKSMRFGPQGISRVGEWVRRLPHIPIVAIGGLKLEHAEAVKLEGADSIAVISDLTQDADPEQRMNAWLNAWQA